jgi:hypothetical protein
MPALLKSCDHSEQGRRRSWRDDIEIHPEVVNLFPRLDPPQLAKIQADIATNGLQNKVVLYRDADGKSYLIDGATRLDALEANGISFMGKDGKLDRTLGLGTRDRIRVVTAADGDPRQLALSLNLHRRHLSEEEQKTVVLTAKQRGEEIERLLRENPGKSNRQISAEIGASHVTVAAKRTELESTGQIDQLKTTTGKDGKARPARRKAKVRAEVIPLVEGRQQPATKIKAKVDRLFSHIDRKSSGEAERLQVEVDALKSKITELEAARASPEQCTALLESLDPGEIIKIMPNSLRRKLQEVALKSLTPGLLIRELDQKVPEFKKRTRRALKDLESAADHDGLLSADVTPRADQPADQDPTPAPASTSTNDTLH